MLAITLTTAQDIITMRTGETINSVITELGISEIRYKRFADKDGATHVLAKSEVFMVEYEDGVKEVIKDTEAEQVQISNKSNYKAYDRGVYDAEHYHKRAAGHVILGFTCGVFGIGASALIEPKDPVKELVGNPEYVYHESYRKGYRKEAKRKNVKHAAFGTCGWLLLLLLL